MATLGWPDYDILWRYVYRKGEGKEEFKALASLPTKQQILAAFQVIEDFWETNRATLKSQVDTAIGQTLTATTAKKLMVSWLLYKVQKGG